VSQATSVRGGWVTLEPVTPLNWPEVRRLDQIRQWSASLGGAPARADASTPFGPAMLIRDHRTAMAVGILENSQMAGYPGVAVVLIYVDEAIARPGLALEAFAMYVSQVFAAGARMVHFEVLEFNLRVQRSMARLGLKELARQRDQVYVAGRFWDLLVYAFDQDEWQRIRGRYARLLPGGDRGPVALGGRRRSGS
jgi:RimJ/RimL family protein N-acetyltransferase